MDIGLYDRSLVTVNCLGVHLAVVTETASCGMQAVDVLLFVRRQREPHTAVVGTEFTRHE